MSSGVFTLPLISAIASPEDATSSPSLRTYVAGPENSLLRILVELVQGQRSGSENSDRQAVPQFNPIVLYGPSGCGKSHLLHGLINRLEIQFAGARTWYLSGADFARQCARAMELDALSELREKFLGTSYLIVDGLEELAEKPSAQHELLYVVDNAADRGALVVVACRHPINEWTWMSPGLKSRLEAGLVIPVALPEPATRMAMIDQILEDLEPVSSTTSEKIGAVKSRISERNKTYPELRGAVLRRIVSERPEDDRPAVSNGRELSHRSEDLRRILKAVSRTFGLKASDLTSSSRRKSIVQARGVAIYLARTAYQISFEELGRLFGGRDHTTISHAFHKIANSLSQDALLKQAIEKASFTLACNVPARDARHDPDLGNP